MAEIRFEKTEKRFKKIPVIKDLDLTIHDGEFFTFVGPSGCGKSTILNMISGLEPVSGGQIFFDNAVVNDLSPRERDIAMVFQSYALYPHMTVYKNIAFPLKMKKTRDETIDKEVKRVAGLLGLEDLLQRKPKELSGGQRQRVALGRAIIRRPKVFLMDEPLSNLDARLRVEMRAELKRLHHELRITTIYVTHDQSEALSLSDRIAVLYKGEVQQCGTPREIYAKPANIFVGSFIGSPPMNFVNATIERSAPLTINCNGMILSPQLETPLKNKDLTVGIRPEDIIVTNKKSEQCIEITVSLVEPAGSFNWVDFMWNNTKIKGTGKSDVDIRAGDKGYAAISTDKITVFDSVSGRRL
jgi:multiple sugar transport system ATP-binding protein